MERKYWNSSVRGWQYDSKKKAEVLNRQFQSVFTIELSNELPDKGSNPFPTMPQIQANESEVRSQLQRLKVHKATSPDNISNKFLKEISHVIAPILTCIFKSH